MRVRPGAGYPVRRRVDELLGNGAITAAIGTAAPSPGTRSSAIISAVVTEPALRSAIRTLWHRCVEECEPVTEQLWRVRTQPVAGCPAQPGRSAGAPEREFVAKWVPAARRTRFQGGLAVAAHLAGLGMHTGAPVPTVDGALSVPLHDGQLALLRRAEGRPLVAADPVDQQFWGDALGAVHTLLAGFTPPGLVRLTRLDPGGAHLGLVPWLRPAVAEATAALVRLTVTDQLSYGVVHGDPGPGALRVDRATGRVALVGWGWAATGLLLYDVAGAVGYIGGIAAAAEFLDGYLAAGPLRRSELEVGLPIVLRCRRARRADELARRLHAGTSTDPSGDRAALEALAEPLTTAAAG